MSAARILAGLLGVTFLVYGVMCFGSLSMANDFHRFGLDGLRVPTGVLELLGGTGLLIGLRWPPARVIAAAGLTLLMLIAFAIRVHMRDGVAASLPSFILMLLDLYVLAKSPRL
jgi:uncharacterized membrane protein